MVHNAAQSKTAVASACYEVGIGLGGTILSRETAHAEAKESGSGRFDVCVRRGWPSYQLDGIPSRERMLCRYHLLGGVNFMRSAEGDIEARNQQSANHGRSHCCSIMKRTASRKYNTFRVAGEIYSRRPLRA